MYRKYITAQDIVDMAENPDEYKRNEEKIVIDDITRKTECDESCEMFEMEL
jgi:hypothetical protein